MNLCFFALVLKQVNEVVIATISIIHMQKFVKNLNLKVFNLMSITNETRHIKWHETCKCKCRFNSSVKCSVIINNVGMKINAGVNAKNY